MTQKSKALTYCIQQVRKYDYKSYLCLLQLHRGGLRESAFALRAFNVETAIIKDHVREPTLAAMRLQWWKDSLDSLYKGKVLEHPVLALLSEVTSKHRLSKHWFNRIIDARVSDIGLASRTPGDVSEIESYAESTASALLYLTLEAAGVRDTRADHAASHTGKAAGICLLLEGTPYHSSQRSCYIPVDVAAKFGVSQEDFYNGAVSEGVARAVYEVASVAHSHLEKARELAKQVPGEAKGVLLPAVPAEQFLNSLMKSGFNPFDEKLRRGVCGVSPFWMLLKLKLYSMRGVY